MVKNGHIHTPFCPHGTKDALQDYIEKAIQLGFTEISFTEHAPLPDGFTDPTPNQDSAMKLEKIEEYLQSIHTLKLAYKGSIRINCGLEVDYIEGFEKETAAFLNLYGHRLDDAILSVHFLKYGANYDCLDYSPDAFADMVDKYGSLQAIYQNYYRTLRKSIDADLGPYKPRRIGHMTLVKKFQRKFPYIDEPKQELLEILDAVKEKDYELDYNGAGTAKPLCRETYPPEWVAKEAIKRGIPLIYGSDAHQVKELKQGYENLISSFA
ncbi:histidinol-phosphatase HisJ [Robertmurraya sp. DFI.2.37]|jgi:histidinol-phosphatase (PHP family)|uniref:histidinol-phosphatase HisJ n=1 Tax=Robertmurraya sp. DFI.2.37 TaxID=3031819 RepID=UPI0012452865|nr:histidinol-phosphatase HisJ [Robertmurraya sp. DFI.2.37]MDF1508719.1 histidinol-phosphatase HisJ [Robertmurraya sp. DFI.2.37]